MFVQQISHTRIDGWNQRQLTEADAMAFCKAHSLYVVDDRRLAHGKLIQNFRSYNFLLINPELEGVMRTWVLWHEIAHFLLHEPPTTHFSPSTKRKQEREANYIAAVAILPRPYIEGRSIVELEAAGYPIDLLKIRWRVSKEGI